jgi:hypothetical protein
MRHESKDEDADDQKKMTNGIVQNYFSSTYQVRSKDEDADDQKKRKNDDQWYSSELFLIHKSITSTRVHKFNKQYLAQQGFHFNRLSRSVNLFGEIGRGGVGRLLDGRIIDIINRGGNGFRMIETGADGIATRQGYIDIVHDDASQILATIRFHNDIVANVDRETHLMGNVVGIGASAGELDQVAGQGGIERARRARRNTIQNTIQTGSTRRRVGVVLRDGTGSIVSALGKMLGLAQIHGI